MIFNFIIGFLRFCKENKKIGILLNFCFSFILCFSLVNKGILFLPEQTYFSPWIIFGMIVVLFTVVVWVGFCIVCLFFCKSVQKEAIYYSTEDNNSYFFKKYFFKKTIVWRNEPDFLGLKNNYWLYKKTCLNSFLNKRIVVKKGQIKLSVVFTHNNNPKKCLLVFQKDCDYGFELFLKSQMIDFINENKERLEAFDNPISSESEVFNLVGEGLNNKLSLYGVSVARVSLEN